MDKFDQNIKDAHEGVEPNSSFVENTMSTVSASLPKKRLSFKVWAPVLAGGLAVVAVIFIALPSGSHLANSVVATKTSRSTSPTYNGSGQPTTAASAPAVGTDNSSLQNDLSDVQSYMNQENSDQNSSNTAINDNQQVITVPTN